MIKNIAFSLHDLEISAVFLAGFSVNEPFHPEEMPGFVGHLQYTDEGSDAHDRGSMAFLTLRHDQYGAEFSGPVFWEEEIWECSYCRADVPKLAGLASGSLPEKHFDIQMSILTLSSLIKWLPDDWIRYCEVEELQLCMIFDVSGRVSAREIMIAHEFKWHPPVAS